MLTVDVGEYRSWEGHVDSDALDELTVLAGKRLEISRRLGGKVEIKATAHVGMIVTPAISVRIRPKVSLDNLFYMLGVGDEAWQVDKAYGRYGETDDDLVTAVVRLLCRELEALTGRGLLHGYVSYEDRLLAIRGRVDLGAVMRRPWERTPVACRFDEFVPDIWVNRVLLAALSHVRRVPSLPPSLRGEVHVLTQRFEGVAPARIDVADIDRWRPGRNDRRYRVAVSLAGVILRHLSLADREGGRRAASFTINMNDLFEDFAGRELRARLPPRLELVKQYETTLDRGDRLKIKPDFVLHPAGRPADPVYVADAKYKLTETLGVTSDHYQLLAYATVFSLDEGALIYCQRADDDLGQDSEPPVSSVVIRGAGIEHFVYRLDVSGRRPDIDRRLDDLATWMLDRLASHETTDPSAPIMNLQESTP